MNQVFIKYDKQSLKKRKEKHTERKQAMKTKRLSDTLLTWSTDYGFSEIIKKKLSSMV